VLFGENKVNGLLEAPVVGIELALLRLVARDLDVVLGLGLWLRGWRCALHRRQAVVV